VDLHILSDAVVLSHLARGRVDRSRTRRTTETVTVVQAPEAGRAVSPILTLGGLDDFVARNPGDDGSTGRKVRAIEGRVVISDVLERRGVNADSVRAHVEQRFGKERGQARCFEGHVVTPEWLCHSGRMKALANVMMV